jgi:HEAT repeat protein
MIRTVIFASLGVLLTGYLLHQIGVGDLIRGAVYALSSGSDQEVAAPVAVPADLPDVAMSEETRRLVNQLASADAEIRRKAAEALGKAGDRAAVVALLRELSDSDVYAKRSAAESLGCVLENAPPDTPGREIALNALIGLLQDKDYGVRYSAIEAHSRLRDRRAVPALLTSLAKDNRENDNRGHAAFALGEIADPVAIEPLIAALKTDTDSWKVSYAIGAIALGGNERAAKFLMDQLRARKFKKITGAGEFFVTQNGPGIDGLLNEMIAETKETTLVLLLAKHRRSKASASVVEKVDEVAGMSYGRAGC